MTDTEYMNIALEIAKETLCNRTDVPIGAIIVRTRDGAILGKGRNTREEHQSATGHAEINAIEEACRNTGSWRLSGCTLYVTLEPCAMCAGACINSRIDRVVYALKDPKAGAFGSVIDLTAYPLNHKPEITHGICEDRARELLREFFLKKRKGSDQK